MSSVNQDKLIFSKKHLKDRFFLLSGRYLDSRSCKIKTLQIETCDLTKTRQATRHSKYLLGYKLFFKSKYKAYQCGFSLKNN